MKRFFFIGICCFLIPATYSQDSLLDLSLTEMERSSIYDTSMLREEAYKFLGCQHSTSRLANRQCVNAYAHQNRITVDQASKKAFVAAANAVGDKWAMLPFADWSKEFTVERVDANAVMFSFKHFQPTVRGALKRLLRLPAARVVIIDLYENLGGYNSVANEVLDTFVDDGPISYLMYANGKKDVRMATSGNIHLWTKDPAIEIRILVSQKTVSNGEYVPRMLKFLRSNVCVIGSPTRGKGVFLRMGKLAYFTVGWQLLPDGTKFENEPMMPDVYASSHEEALAIAKSPVACQNNKKQ